MPDSHQNITRRALCRFDSPDWVAEVLMDALGRATPRVIADLGSGGGALSLAALSRWSPSELVTVDLDNAAGVEIRDALSSHDSLFHRHVTADLTQPLAEHTGAMLSGTVDLVVSNPPYRATRWTPAMAQILERAGLPAPAAICGDIPADLIFVAQALNLVRSGGSLGLILPDSMISGKIMAPFRKALMEAHRVARVIQLPRRAFKGTDAQAYVVVIEQGGSSPPVRLDRIMEDGTWLRPIEIDTIAAAMRLDHSFHDAKQSVAPATFASLRDLGVVVSRGRLSSKQLDGPDPTFHTSDFPKTMGAGVTLSPIGLMTPETGGWALSGDLLLARVDRRLEHKIAHVVEGAARLSDCVLSLRCPPTLRARVLRGLTSPWGQEQLIAHARGTGARHISVRSLLDILV